MSEENNPFLGLPAMPVRLDPKITTRTLKPAVKIYFYKLYNDPEGFEAQWTASVESLKIVPMLPVVILCGFFVGTLLRMVIGKHPPAWFQDVAAWLSLIAVLLMSVATLIHLVINPSLDRDSPLLSLTEWECILSAVVAFYFGERS